MWARLSVRDRRLADIGVGMSGKLPSQASTAFTRFGHGREVAALNDLLDQAAVSRRQ